MSNQESVRTVYEEQSERFDDSGYVAVDALTTYAAIRDRLADNLEQGTLSPEQERAAFARLQADVLHS